MQGGIRKGLQLVQHLSVLSSSTSHIDVFQSWSHEFFMVKVMHEGHIQISVKDHCRCTARDGYLWTDKLYVHVNAYVMYVYVNVLLLVLQQSY